MRTTTKCHVVGSLVLGSLLLASTASAQALEDRTAVTFENIVGVLWQKLDYPDMSGYDAKPVRYIGAPSGIVQFGAPALSRVGVHHFFGGLSVGAALHYSDNDDFGTHTVLAPRVGYAFPWGDSSALWLRGGVTWAKWSLNDDGRTGLLAGGEVLAVMMPVDNVGIMLGGTYEHGLMGTHKNEEFNVEEDVRMYAYGFTVGMAFVF